MLLVVAAFEPELAPLRAALGERLGEHVVLAAVGIGLLEAPLGTIAALDRHQPESLLFVGTAGFYPGAPLAIGGPRGAGRHRASGGGRRSVAGFAACRAFPRAARRAAARFGRDDAGGHRRPRAAAGDRRAFRRTYGTRRCFCRGPRAERPRGGPSGDRQRNRPRRSRRLARPPSHRFGNPRERPRKGARRVGLFDETLEVDEGLAHGAGPRRRNIDHRAGGGADGAPDADEGVALPRRVADHESCDLLMSDSWATPPAVWKRTTSPGALTAGARPSEAMFGSGTRELPDTFDESVVPCRTRNFGPTAT
ncbi:hypothetical protein OUZ56_033102 [Daphnia magna]|uniref:Uncharacterized protein n=1 Tax=Daphnia magna TaxID=35525 RepID=A0ABR0BA71_9CRUS|nr:hypothetical protein OUZ56_033102 [Daphnia magna]